MVCAFGLVATVIGGFFAYPVLEQWWEEGAELAQQHQSHVLSHPGWSFPARVWTEAVDPSKIPAKHRIAEAKARNYQANCKSIQAGEYCEKTGVVIPRQGNTLEPIFMGWLIGPDSELRAHLPLQEAPKHLIDAIISAEDASFYEHLGVNFKSMGRAVWANLNEGGYAQGGSTLTMQVVRNLSQQKEKTITRKLREMVMAMSVDNHLGKDGVLQMYLDAPYLGQRGGISICGFEEASWFYFNHSAHDLSLAEAATLAAILPAPGKFSPDTHPEEAKIRRDRVLNSMVALGYDVHEALATPVQTTQEKIFLEPEFPAYFSVMRDYLAQTLPPEQLYGAGLEITAGINVGIQMISEEVFKKKTAMFEARYGRKSAGELQSVGILMDVHNSQLLAVYGGQGMDPHGFNRASQARRQPGSAFKPVVYAMAFSQPPKPDGSPSFSMASTVPNNLRTFKTPQGDWRPKNIDEVYHKEVSLAFGLVESQNIATASLLEQLGGPQPLIKFASSLGFDTSKYPEELGLALGQAEVTPLEMARLIGTLAADGLRASGIPVIRAMDAAGQEVLHAPALGDRILSHAAALQTRELMRQVVEGGTGQEVRGKEGEPGYLGRVMGKTGTTDGQKDLWFIGATPDLAGVVWIGYDTPAPIRNTARHVAAPLWGWWFRAITENKEDPAFIDDPNYITAPICAESGKLANESCWWLKGSFLKGQAPKEACPYHHMLAPVATEEVIDEDVP